MPDDIEDKNSPEDPLSLSRIYDLIQACEESDHPTIHFLKEASRPSDIKSIHLGVLPSAFDPMTNAHALLASKAREIFSLDEILFLLDLRNADKKSFGAPLKERLWLLNRFCASEPSYSVGLSSHGLFVEKIDALIRVYPEPVEIYFIVGFDTLPRIFDRKYYEDQQKSLNQLFKGARIVVANRGKWGKAEYEELRQKPEYSPFWERILFLPVEKTLSTLSSTMIRERLREGLPIDSWVPERVSQGIRLRGLYGARPSLSSNS